MEKENREYKDSLFVDLFYKDETAEKNLLSLYNALHDTDLKDDGLIRKIKIEDILYKNFKNDVSFELNGKVIVFGEHQSTVNPNMPLRCLLYAGRVYEELVDDDARYRTRLVRIPTPEFYVFYNGVKDFPMEEELVLSDAFLNPPGENSLELKVKVININSDKAHDILKKCEILRQYSIFIDTIRKYADSEESAVKMAINECMEKGILVEYLKRKGSEVRNMLIAEYSYEKDIRIKQQEARQEGRQEGIMEGWDQALLLSGKIIEELKRHPFYTSEQIAEGLGCRPEIVEDIRKKWIYRYERKGGVLLIRWEALRRTIGRRHQERRGRMASKEEFVTYVTEQMKDAGEITCRKMFGEYGVYCDGKIFALICDDQLFLKITKEGERSVRICKEALPYEGAKPYFLVEELDDRELMTRLVQETVKALPEPKKKKKK